MRAFLPYFARPHIANIARETGIFMTEHHGGYGMPTPSDRLNALRTSPSTPLNATPQKKMRPELMVLCGLCLFILLLGSLYVRTRNKVAEVTTNDEVASQTIQEIQREAATSVVLDGEVLFGVALKAGNFPTELKVGDVVRAVVTPVLSGAGDARELEARMTVMSVGAPGDLGGDTVVTLSGPQSVPTEIAMSGPIHLTIVEVAPK
ncbi:MAG: hypothetical protein RLZ18_9 [Actinomycetota bacterium]|jgi:hypothetical protein